MSGLMVPVSVMYTSILACRLILDLRDRGGKAPGQTASEQRQIASYTHQHRPVIGPDPHIAPGIRVSRVGVMGERDLYGLAEGGAITQMGFNHEPESYWGDAGVDDKGEGSSGESRVATMRAEANRRPRSLSMLGIGDGGVAGYASDEAGDAMSEFVSNGEVPHLPASRPRRGIMVNVESHQRVDLAGSEFKTRGRRARKSVS